MSKDEAERAANISMIFGCIKRDSESVTENKFV